MDYTEIDKISQSKYPNTFDGLIEYGTAGFRTKSDRLDHVVFRMGLLAALRSKEKNAAIGLMITASHNREPDNGVKLVDPVGEMLDASWEVIATEVANARDSDLVSILQRVVTDRRIEEGKQAIVVIGRDTRHSSPRLANAAIDAFNATHTQFKDYGLITTPQLHYFVVCKNEKPLEDYTHIDVYYSQLTSAFRKLCSNGKKDGKYKSRVRLDAANGVGAIAANQFKNLLADILDMEVLNSGDGELNDNCGADYVKIQQAPPLNMPTEANQRYLSIDGDADRIVYYYVDETKKFHLLDGDRIATLVAGYLKELIQASGLAVQLGLVQTAYANGASTDYISQVLKVPVACVPTGVKHLHRRAHEFDVGVYFEANGHGTVVFKDDIVGKIREASRKSSGQSPSQQESLNTLVNLTEVINQSVGDALSIMLLVESILYAKDWDLATWEQSYKDFPNKQLKVCVKDRKVITTTDAERKCVTPKGLQDKIDEIVALYPKGRSFVRPSGTEDIVRVYAECESSQDVERLAAQVSLAVHRLAGGVGPEPVVPS